MKKVLKIIILIAILVILLIILYFRFSPKPAQYSPPLDESTLSFENSKALLSAFPPEGIDWYCGNTDSYTDAQGNVYGAKELEELKKILGNAQQLELEFC